MIKVWASRRDYDSAIKISDNSTSTSMKQRFVDPEDNFLLYLPLLKKELDIEESKLDIGKKLRPRRGLTAMRETIAKQMKRHNEVDKELSLFEN